MKGVEKCGCEGANKEGVGEGLVEGLCEHTFWSLFLISNDISHGGRGAYNQHILRAQSQRSRERLACPLMRWIDKFPGQVLRFCIQDPSYATIINRHTNE